MRGWQVAGPRIRHYRAFVIFAKKGDMELLGTLYPFFKALHIVGFVAWFAGLFYLVRIFVYHAEAADRPEPDQTILKKQYQIMEWRVYKIICNPAMMITWTFGLLMLLYQSLVFGMLWWNDNFWIYPKLVLLILMIVYQLWCKRIIQRHEKDEFTLSSFQFRLANELPTLFLVSIVLLAVYKNTLNFLTAFGGILIFGILLYFGAKLYKRQRESKNNA
jgi:putative membrane protein